MIIVESYSPSIGKKERIVVPRDYLHGLLECLHLKLQHPSKSQLRQVFGRAYYALDLEEALEAVTKRCHTCVSLSNMPNRFMSQKMTTNPSTVGSNLSADVIKRAGQLILLIREYVSSYTSARLIPNEKASTIRTALLVQCSELTSQSGPIATIKLDPASASRSLVGDAELKNNGIILELGEAKYINKNPVAERAIRELHSELNRVLEGSSVISEQILARAVANLNSRIRGEGVSSREIWTQRNQFSGEQIPIKDKMLIRSQEEKKEKSHIPSATYKSRGKRATDVAPVHKGDIIYINTDREKTHPRERYIVIETYKDACKVQKFVGMQLRARPYMVNRSNLIIVQPWEFENTSSNESDDDDEANEVKVKKSDEKGNVGDRQLNNLDESVDREEEGILGEDEGEEDEVEEDEVEEDEDEEDEDEEAEERPEVTTRSGRLVKLPDKYKDFTVRRE